MSVQPCPHCPIVTWAAITDPNTAAGERQIRADQRRLDLRELQATAKDLSFLIDNLSDRDPVHTLNQIRRLCARLITLSERKAAA